MCANRANRKPGSTGGTKPRWLHFLFSTAITLVTALMNWPPVFHLLWLGHVPHVRQHLPTTIVWNSPMRELIGSVIFFPLYFPPLELSPLFCISSFLQPSFLQKAGLSPPQGLDGTIFFFITLFRHFIKLFYSFHYTSFPFLKGCRLEKGHIVPVLCSHS